MRVDETLIGIECGKCGTDHSFKLSDIVAEANLPPGENHLVHTISQPCDGCDDRLEVEIALDLD